MKVDAHHYAENCLKIGNKYCDFKNREPNFKHFDKCITEHRMRFCCIAGVLNGAIPGTQQCSMCQGLKPCTDVASNLLAIDL